jgi:hypothetical protein
MARDLHTIAVSSGSDLSRSDRLIFAQLTVSTAAGGSAGASVTTAVTLNLPPSYKVQLTPSQDAVGYVTSKTSTGFNIVLNPRLASATLAAGTVDVTITA